MLLNLMSGHLIREHIIETAKEMSVSLQIITGYELHIIMNMGITFTFHKVMTKISWLDKISWSDMSCWGVKVIKAILLCYWIHICEYFDAFGTKVLVMGTICSRITNLHYLISCPDIC